MKSKKPRVWDCDQPCQFRIWHKPSGRRARVTGYSLNQFCEEQKWSLGDVTASWLSTAHDLRAVVWFETIPPDPQPGMFFPKLKKGK